MAGCFDTHEVFNQSPPYEDVDLFASDRPLRDAVAANGAGEDAKALSAFGQRWGRAEMFELGRQANEHPPQAQNASMPRGSARDVVEFHPAYHLLHDREHGRCGCTLRPGARTAAPAPPPAQVSRAARFYMAAQVETGHLCPIDNDARGGCCARRRARARRDA